jgi:hypothetical protein
MKHEIILIENYLLIVNDDIIKENDWYYLEKVGEISSNSGAYKCETRVASKLNTLASNCKKIIGHLPLNNEPILDGVSLLPLLPDIKITENDLREAIIAFAMDCEHNEDLICYEGKDENGVRHYVDANKWVDGHLENLKIPKYPKYFNAEIIDIGHPTTVLEIGMIYYTNEDSLFVPYEYKTMMNKQFYNVFVGDYEY